MADADVKAMTAEIDCPTFEATAFNRLAKPLSECTVAIVTTASLHHADQPDFGAGDTGYRVLDATRDDLQLGHWSPNFDTTGFAVDPNVVFPLRRLHELVEQGRIGAVAERHLSYAGNQFELSAIRLDSGPAGAKLLVDDGIDVVLLTPV
jgi:D-proline reductase (dithiol) PrdB